MHRGFILLYRKFLEWEWYDDVPCKTVYLHCLLNAAYTDKKYRGKVVARGSLLTSREKLAEETGLTPQQVRTALIKMSPEHLTYSSTSHGTQIFVVEYETYNTGSSAINQPSNQPRPGHQPAKRSSVNQQRNQPTGHESTNSATNGIFDETSIKMDACDDDGNVINQPFNQQVTNNTTNETPAEQPANATEITTTKKQKKQEKQINILGSDMAEPSPTSLPESKTKSSGEKDKPTHPPERFTKKQADFYYAFWDVEFFVPGKGIVRAIEAISDPLRLAETLGNVEVYPAVDVGLVSRLGAWTFQNKTRAKKNVGRFILNRAAYSQDRGGGGGGGSSPRGGGYSTMQPVCGDLEAKTRKKK